MLVLAQMYDVIFSLYNVRKFVYRPIGDVGYLAHCVLFHIGLYMQCFREYNVGEKVRSRKALLGLTTGIRSWLHRQGEYYRKQKSVVHNEHMTHDTATTKQIIGANFKRGEKRRNYIHRVPKKGSHFYFLNSSVRHWPILIIFGMQHQQETWRNWL